MLLHAFKHGRSHICLFIELVECLPGKLKFICAFPLIDLSYYLIDQHRLRGPFVYLVECLACKNSQIPMAL